MEPIQATERQSLKQMVIKEIKQYILDQQLTAGDKLPTERHFTEMYGVSRSVVREALSYLENIGIVRIRQGQGAFLNESNIDNLLNSFFFLWQINKGNVRDILGLRVLFECSAIDEIMHNGDNLAVQTLRDLTADQAHAESPEARRQADIAFHQQILKATKNHLFQQMTSMITNYFFQIQHIELSKAEYEQLTHEHEQIVQALEEKNGVSAKKLLTDHIKHTKA